MLAYQFPQRGVLEWIPIWKLKFAKDAWKPTPQIVAYI